MLKTSLNIKGLRYGNVQWSFSVASTWTLMDINFQEVLNVMLL